MQELNKKLQKVTSNIIKSLRTKSITKSAEEINLSKSIWADLERGIKDPQFSTLWRISEGLNIKTSELIKLIEDELGENFSFLEGTIGK